MLFENFDPVEKRNLETTLKMIKNHFSLNEDSFKELEKRAKNPFIPDFIKNKLDNNLRYKISLTPSEMEYIDKGWSVFNDIFHYFVSKDNITYKDFIENAVRINGQKRKLIKHIVKKSEKLFEESSTEDLSLIFELPSFMLKEKERFLSFIQERINEIITFKLPLEQNAILSYNFSDWLFCSTAEDWSSCLNLNSSTPSGLWSSLPGFIFNKNVAFFYINSGKRKRFDYIERSGNSEKIFSVELDRFRNRSFLLLNEDDTFDIVKWYPSKFPISQKIKDEMFISNNNKKLKYDFYLTEAPKTKKGYTIYPFQDSTRFDKNYKLVKDGLIGKHQFLKKNDDKIYFGDFTHTPQFVQIMSLPDELSNFRTEPENLKSCKSCGYTSFRNDYSYRNGFCFKCLREMEKSCENCGEVIIGEPFEVDGLFYCEACYDELF